jgi:hypothetical protein
MNLHTKTSFLKSGLRIGGYLLLLAIHNPTIQPAVLVLVASEIIGIIEECVV